MEFYFLKLCSFSDVFRLKNCRINNTDFLCNGMKKLSTELLLITYYLIDFQFIISKMLIFFKRVNHSEIVLYEVDEQ